MAERSKKHLLPRMNFSRHIPNPRKQGTEHMTPEFVLHALWNFLSSQYTRTEGFIGPNTSRETRCDGNSWPIADNHTHARQHASQSSKGNLNPDSSGIKIPEETIKSITSDEKEAKSIGTTPRRTQILRGTKRQSTQYIPP
jgi:hypothetical protein